MHKHLDVLIIHKHLMLSPNGDRFIFLHRWKMEEGGIYDRLYTANEDGNDIYLLNDSGRVGHFCWQNNKSVLIYGGISNPLNRLRRYKKLVKYLFKPLLPLYHKCVADNSNLSKALTGDSYVLLQDHTQEKKRVALAISDEDGHPSFPANRDDVFITDIYPNPGPERGSFAKLIKFDLSTNTAENIAELESIPEYDDSPIRCDLHPKIAYDGKHVSVDTMDRGVRGIYLYAVF